jgi:hypothetical protein
VDQALPGVGTVPDAENVRAVPDVETVGAVPDVETVGAVPDVETVGAVPDVENVGAVPDVEDVGAVPDVEDVLLIAGPGLPGADNEVRQLADLYPDARLLAGEEATVSRVLDGLGKARLVHLAAHGTFRADSPLFSSFLLSDGPLTVHDLEGAAVAADTVVLAACNAGVSGVIGNELIGTGASLLTLGVRSIVAPLVAIPDAPTARFMVELHRGLRAGLPASAALAATRSGTDAEVASVFICLGRVKRQE